ncbi:MAG: anti-sigma factor [Chloroflexi bacterium]|nr:anti-sigma factor [Chloroflexota bacterium]
MIEDSGQAYWDDLAAYALGALDPERRREIETRLESDPELRAELEEMQEIAASLALLVPSQEPPRSLKSRLLQRFEMELQARRTVAAPVPMPRESAWAKFRRRALTPRVAYVAPAMVMVAIAASAVSVFAFNSLVDRRIEAIQDQMQTAEKTAESTPGGVTAANLQEAETKLDQKTASRVEEAEAKLDEKTASRVEEVKAELDQKTSSRLAEAQAELESLKKTVNIQTKLMQVLNREGAASTWLAGQDEAANATAVLAANRSGEPAYLWVNGLPTPPDGKQYQLWLYYQGRIWSPGTFTVEPADGSAWVELYLPLAVTYPVYAAVTVEPQGGSQRPTGPNVLTSRR